MNFPGAPGRGYGGRGDTVGMSEQEQAMVRAVSYFYEENCELLLTSLLWQMQAVMESCPGKTVISGGMGFLLGGAFGLFMSSVRHACECHKLDLD